MYVHYRTDGMLQFGYLRILVAIKRGKAKSRQGNETIYTIDSTPIDFH